MIEDIKKNAALTQSEETYFDPEDIHSSPYEPVIGAIVYYRFPGGFADKLLRPAIIVEVKSNDRVDIQVFSPLGTTVVTNVQFSRDPNELHTWCWAGKYFPRGPNRPVKFKSSTDETLQDPVTDETLQDPVLKNSAHAKQESHNADQEGEQSESDIREYSHADKGRIPAKAGTSDSTSSGKKKKAQKEA